MLSIPIDKLKELLELLKGKFIDLDSDYQLGRQLILYITSVNINYNYCIYLIDIKNLQVINTFWTGLICKIDLITTESYGIFLSNKEKDYRDYKGISLNYTIFLVHSTESKPYNLNIDLLLKYITVLSQVKNVNLYYLKEIEPNKINNIESLDCLLNSKVKLLLNEL